MRSDRLAKCRLATALSIRLSNPKRRVVFWHTLSLLVAELEANVVDLAPVTVFCKSVPPPERS